MGKINNWPPAHGPVDCHAASMPGATNVDNRPPLAANKQIHTYALMPPLERPKSYVTRLPAATHTPPNNSLPLPATIILWLPALETVHKLSQSCDCTTR